MKNALRSFARVLVVISLWKIEVLCISDARLIQVSNMIEYPYLLCTLR